MFEIVYFNGKRAHGSEYTNEKFVKRMVEVLRKQGKLVFYRKIEQKQKEENRDLTNRLFYDIISI